MQVTFECQQAARLTGRPLGHVLTQCT